MNSNKNTVPFDLHVDAELVSFFDPTTWEVALDVVIYFFFLKIKKRKRLQVLLLPSPENEIPNILNFLEQEKILYREIVVHGQIKVKFSVSDGTALCCRNNDSNLPCLGEASASYILPIIWPNFVYDYSFLTKADKSVYLDIDTTNYRCTIKGCLDGKKKIIIVPELKKEASL